MGKRQPIYDAPVTIYLVGSKESCSKSIKEQLFSYQYHAIDLDELDQPVLSLIDTLHGHDLKENAWEKVNFINQTVFDLVAKDFEKNYIIGNVLLLNKYDEIIFHQIKKMADARSSLFLPVLLLPEVATMHPLAKELKESRYYLVLSSKDSEKAAATILAYVQKMKDDFAAQPDLICDEVIIDESANPAARTFLKNGVVDYNKRYLGEWKPKPFSIYIRNAEGDIIAGVCGDYIKAYTRINWTWVHEDYRSRGVGRRVLNTLEEFAREKGCRYMQLDTMDFQAKPFYLRLGFFVVATLPNWINGHECYIMRKELSVSS